MAPWLLLAGALAAIGAILFALAPSEIHDDTWIALVAGRDVAGSGIPTHETLTLIAHGRAWIDQQWLAQLSMYELERLGGLALAGFVDVALVLGAVVGAVLAALRLGARLRSVAWILPVALCGLLVGLEPRTQAFGYPLMVAIVYLLATDARRPSAKVWWCLPLLVLWGNLHGSAIMAAGLVGLRGLTVAWARRSQLPHSLFAWGKPLGLLLGAPLCLIANPYGFSVVSYYRATVFNPDLRHLIAEWQPVTSSIAMTVVVSLLILAAGWSLVRHRGQSTPWERFALLALTVGAVVAIRNVPWLALGSLVLLPVWIDPAVGARAWRPRGGRVVLVSAGVAAFASAWLLQEAMSTFTRPASAWGPGFPAGALVAVQSELGQHPGWRVYGDETLADWLLWKLPAVRGRIATDARFELLSSRQLNSQVALVSARGPDWRRAARGYRLLVINDALYPQAAAALRRDPGARTIYDSAHTVVIVRSAASSST